MKTAVLAIAAWMMWPMTGMATVRSLTPTRPWTSLQRELEMESYVELIFKAAGRQAGVPVVVDPAAKNNCAYATTVKEQDYIAVFGGCVGPLRQGMSLNWFAVGVLCHEASHILAGHTRNYHSSQAEESAADEGSGWLMFRLGLTLEQALTTPSRLPVEDSPSHPRRTVRMASVERGWLRAQANARSSGPAVSGGRK